MASAARQDAPQHRDVRQGIWLSIAGQSAERLERNSEDSERPRKLFW